MRDKEDTGQVFEIMGALNGPTTARNIAQLLATPGGGRLAYEHVELAPKLMDDVWLDSFAPGTVGAAYRDFVRSEQLSADGLAEISRERRGPAVDDRAPLRLVRPPHPRQSRHLACALRLPPRWPRRGVPGRLLLRPDRQPGLGGDCGRRGAQRPQARRASLCAGHLQGYRRGKAAGWLPGEDYVALMAEPLEAARRRLGITPATLYDAIPSEARNFAIPDVN